MFVSLLIIALDLHCQFPVILRPRFCVAQKPSDLGADLRCSYIAMSDHMAMQLSKLWRRHWDLSLSRFQVCRNPQI
jgi:predicted transposase YbfD/YdcC